MQISSHIKIEIQTSHTHTRICINIRLSLSFFSFLSLSIRILSWCIYLSSSLSNHIKILSDSGFIFSAFLPFVITAICWLIWATGMPLQCFSLHSRKLDFKWSYFTWLSELEASFAKIWDRKWLVNSHYCISQPNHNSLFPVVSVMDFVLLSDY